MEVRADAAGRLMALDASATTRKLMVERRPWLDLEPMARRYAALDAAGKGMGDLSGRGSAEATIDGARITVDYGRPSKRGRVIYGQLVPFGEVWRTGANAATGFTTDRDLAFGDVVVPAGEYTLFTIPGPEAWTLIVHDRTEIAGTAHDPQYDLVRLPLKVSALDATVEDFTIRVDDTADGGVLRLLWDRTEAAAAFSVR
jgi:hypothetical protein